jgi:hypothetical protein
MSLYKRKDSPYWWIKLTPRRGRCLQQSTGTADKRKAQELHDKLKASLWDEERLGLAPQRSWREAVLRWLAETSEKATHGDDRAKLRWLDPFLGPLQLYEITLEVIDRTQGQAPRGLQGHGGPVPGALALDPVEGARRLAVAR